MKLEKYKADYHPTGTHDRFGEPDEEMFFVRDGEIEIDPSTISTVKRCEADSSKAVILYSVGGDNKVAYVGVTDELVPYINS